LAQIYAKPNLKPRPINLHSQTYESDTVGTHCNGVIYTVNTINSSHQTTFGGKAYLIEGNYPSGYLAYEFVRNDDSSFLYTEYYDLPGRREKRQGLVVLSDVLTGDTIITFDPETYEESIYFPKYVFPTGRWVYFDSEFQEIFEGFKIFGVFAGYYKGSKRHGRWEYNSYNIIDQAFVWYEYGKEVNRIYQNKINSKSTDSTAQALAGDWMIAPFVESEWCYTQIDISKTIRLVPVGEGYLSGEVYQFLSRGKLVVYPKEKIDEESRKTSEEGIIFWKDLAAIKPQTGQWRLTSYNQLVLEYGGKKLTFGIEAITSWIILLNK
jgi:hypothetical protein